MSKTPIIVVDSGELYVFGSLVSRHPDFPWLFSITDIYKACEKPIRKEALRKGKNPDTFFRTRAPSQWLRTKDEHTIQKSAKSIRKRLTKYGINCGFGVVMSSSTVRRRTVDELTDTQICMFKVEGGSAKARVHGTYVCQNWIVQYAAFLNESLSEEITNTFISVLNGYTEEITLKTRTNECIAKGTQTRRENKQLNDELVEACGRKHLLPMKVQQGVNEGVLGMTATKYKKLHDIKEPFNDNLTEDQVSIKNMGIILATMRVRNHPKPELNHKEGNMIGLTSGQRARKLAEESKD